MQEEDARQGGGIADPDHQGGITEPADPDHQGGVTQPAARQGGNAKAGLRQSRTQVEFLNGK